MTRTVATKLAEARKLIERGWVQHTMFGPDGAVCIRGALIQTFGATEYAEEARATALLQQATGFTRYLGDWNDAPGRTREEVIEAFKRAEQLAGAE